MQFTPDLTGQSFLNASIQDDNSYINAPPSPTQVDTDSDYVQSYEDVAAVNEANALALADEDMSAAIF